MHNIHEVDACACSFVRGRTTSVMRLSVRCVPCCGGGWRASLPQQAAVRVKTLSKGENTRKAPTAMMVAEGGEKDDTQGTEGVRAGGGDVRLPDGGRRGGGRARAVGLGGLAAAHGPGGAQAHERFLPSLRGGHRRLRGQGHPHALALVFLEPHHAAGWHGES